MLVVDWPTVLDMPVELGTLVVISLDPVASVAALQDEQATREAAEIQPGKYLALVTAPSAMLYSHEEGGVQLALSFMLAGRGLPSPPFSKAAVPIAPTPPHPELNRQPIQGSTGLPWSDCYLHTLQHLAARVSRIYQHRSTGPSFTEDQQDNINELWQEDSQLIPESRAVWHDIRPDDDELDNVNPRTPEGQQFVLKDHDDPMLNQFPVDDGRPQMGYHVHLWVDITAFDILDRPENLAAEKQRLLAIEWDWAQRTVAALLSKKPQTTAWLEAAANADAPDAGEAIGAVVDDDSIAPEDAIEHRTEREMFAVESQEFDQDADSAGAVSPIRHASPAIDPCASSDAQSSAGSTASRSTSLASSSSVVPRATKGTDAFSGMHARNNGLSAFRWILSSLGTLVSRLRSFFWGLVFQRPFAGR